MDDRDHNEKSLGAEGQQDSNPPSQMGKGSIGPNRNGADLDSNRAGSTNDSPKTDEPETDGSDVPGSPDVNTEDYKRARETVTRELDKLSVALETGEAVLVDGLCTELGIKGKGKQPPKKSGIWIFQVRYKRGTKE